MNKISGIFGCLQRLSQKSLSVAVARNSRNGICNWRGIFNGCLREDIRKTFAATLQITTSSPIIDKSKLVVPVRALSTVNVIGNWRVRPQLTAPSLSQPPIFSNERLIYNRLGYLSGTPWTPLQESRQSYNLYSLHRRGPCIKKRKKRRPLDGRPFAKGVVLKTLIKKPKKPNSANRKCVLVKLSTGKEMLAHVPGEGHNLQEHNIVLVRIGRLKDVPGVKLKVVRGKYDCPHVVKKTVTT